MSLLPDIVAISEGDVVSMHDRSFHILGEASKHSGVLKYSHSNREVSMLWANRMKPQSWDEGRVSGNDQDTLLGPMIQWTNEDNPRRLWPIWQNRIKNQFKDKFFLQLTNRIPGLIWCCNPETSTPAALIYMIRELTGLSSTNEAIYASQQKPELFMGLAQTLWMYSTLTHMSGGLSDALPIELRLNMMLSMVEALLLEMEKAQSAVPPQRPTVTLTVLQSLGVPCDVLTESYDEETDLSQKGRMDLNRQEFSRVGGSVFWTNLSLHHRCVDCGAVLASLKTLEEHHHHTCPRLPEGNSRPCSKCNMSTPGTINTKIHSMTVCKRTCAAKCPVCGDTADSSPCFCSKNSDMIWRQVRDYIVSGQNPLCTVKHLATLQAVIILHGRTQIDFSPVGEANIWSSDSFRALREACGTRGDYDESHVTALLNQLPKLDEGGTAITVPNTKVLYTPDDLSSLLAQGNPETSLDNTYSWDPQGDLGSHLFTPHGGFTPQRKGIHAPERKLFEGTDGQESLRPPPSSPQPIAMQAWEQADNKKKLFMLRIAMRSAPHMEALASAGICGDGATAELMVSQLQIQAVTGAGVEQKPMSVFGRSAQQGIYLGGKGPSDGSGLDLVREAGQSQAPVLCRHETHNPPMPFKTLTDKLSHLIKAHCCPYKTLVSPVCSYHAEFESEMLLHIQEKHSIDNFNCSLCSTVFKSEAQRDSHVRSSHPMCPVCRIFLRDAGALRDHNYPSPCVKYLAAPPPEERKAPAYLEPQMKSDLEIYRRQIPDPSAELSKSLTLMAQSIPGLDEGVKNGIIDSFNKICSMQKAVAYYEKFPANAKKLKRNLLECPNFAHSVGSKENMSRVTDFLGKTKLWSPSTSPKLYFQNFLELTEINTAIVRATAACNLSERSATALLLQKFDVSTLWQLESRQFSPPHQWKYETVLSVSQDTFFLLNLEELAISAEQARKGQNESFSNFYCRSYKLLSTASLGRDPQERQDYIASNLKRLALRGSPHKVRVKIEGLEISQGFSYTAGEIMDFVKSEEILNSVPNGEAESELLETFQVTHVTKPTTKLKRSKPKPESRPRNRVRAVTATDNHSPANPTKRLALPPPAIGAGGSGGVERRWTRKQGDPPTASGHQNVDQGVYRSGQGARNGADQSSGPPAGRYGPGNYNNIPPTGPVHTPRDLYTQARDNAAVTKYVLEMRKKLEIPESEVGRWCWRCAAGLNLPGLQPYHAMGKCKNVPHSDNIHNCGPPVNRKLIHSAAHCPFKKEVKRVNTIRLIQDN